MTPDDTLRRAAFLLLLEFDRMEDERSHRLFLLKGEVQALINENPAEAERLALKLFDEREVGQGGWVKRPEGQHQGFLDTSPTEEALAWKGSNKWWGSR